MIVTAALSLIAGVLTVLAPCVLPFLPVIVGGSLTGQRWRPYVVAATLVVSLILFTIILKTSSALLFIDPTLWTSISGIIVIALGLTMLFPDLWSHIATKLGLGDTSHTLLDNARTKQGISSAVLTGAALGPVFSSCSPTYAWVIATILPISPVEGLIYLAIYCIGLACALLAIALLGRTLTAKLQWAANPYGWFQKTIALVFIIVGISVMTGLDRQIQTALADYSLDLAAFEEQLVPHTEGKPKTTGVTHVAGTQAWTAPELQDIQTWINSEPLTLEQLRGNVVLIDFWTYSCINCIRTQPYLNAWYQRYADKGLVIIGVHAPEFAFEKVPANVQKAVIKEQIHYPVALDNNFTTWNAYNNHYWPAKYLIDQQGVVRYTHFGEGDYEATEQAIQQLLGISDVLQENVSQQLTHEARQETTAEQSPETYFGLKRAERYQGRPFLQGGTAAYTFADQLDINQWSLSGSWHVDPEKITAQEQGATLAYRFTGRTMHLVLSSERFAQVHVEGKTIDVNQDSLYTIVELDKPTSDMLVYIKFDAGVSAYAVTFGS